MKAVQIFNNTHHLCNPKRTLLATALAAVTLQASAAELSTDPGDMVALPAGTGLGVFYYQHAERDKVNVDGHSVPTKFGLNSDIMVARYVEWMDVGGYTITPQIIVPFGRLKQSAPQNEEASGLGDPLVGSMIWLINDPVNERWLNVGGFVGVPVGKYDADQGGINIGSNRWKGVLQTGYVQAIIPHKLYGEVTFEYDMYDKNDDFLGKTLRQDNIFETTLHLRYAVNDRNQVGLTYYHTVGGENHLDGLAQDDGLNTKRYMVTWQNFITPKTQAQFQFGRDLGVTNGPKEKLRLQFRLTHVF